MSNLEAEARRYIPLPHTVVPTKKGLALYAARGSRREYVETFDSADQLVSYLLAHFESMHNQALAEKERYERSSPVKIDFTL